MKIFRMPGACGLPSRSFAQPDSRLYDNCAANSSFPESIVAMAEPFWESLDAQQFLALVHVTV
jgi:hypothetical protein